jgi:hypothetical protein
MHLPFPMMVFVLPERNHLGLSCVCFFRQAVAENDVRLYLTGYMNKGDGTQDVLTITLTDPYDSNRRLLLASELDGTPWGTKNILPNIIFNTLFAMAARPEYVESGKRIGNMKKSKSELWTPNIIGRKYATKYDPNAETGTHASPRMHWRRGHFRQQACGIGRLEHKIIWIEPMLVNAKVAGE